MRVDLYLRCGQIGSVSSVECDDIGLFSGNESEWVVFRGMDVVYCIQQLSLLREVAVEVLFGGLWALTENQRCFRYEADETESPSCRNRL